MKRYNVKHGTDKVWAGPCPAYIEIPQYINISYIYIYRERDTDISDM